MTLQLATPTTATANRRAIDPYSLGNEDWRYDIKLDGIRALCEVGINGNVLIFNRNGVEIGWKYPEVVEDLLTIGESFRPLIIDTEIVAISGSFEDVAIRDKQSTPSNAKAHTGSHPVRVIAFDCIARQGQDIRSSPLGTRGGALEEMLGGSRVKVVPHSIDPAIIEMARDLGFEGVIAKDRNSQYVGGRRSSWLKFKNLHRITCIATGYEPGQGARSHFGAMHLAVLRDGKPVSCGRVGTGFSEADISYLKAHLDCGDPLLVEVECLNRTKNGSLRFPVFKGIRTDVSIASASFDQIEALPTC